MARPPNAVDFVVEVAGLTDQLVEQRDGVGRRACEAVLALVQDHGAVTHPADRVEVVTHDHHGRARVADLGHLVEALHLERHVTDGEHFVDEQHARIHVDGHREAEPHEHARRIELHRRVDEVPDVGELHDRVEAGIHLGAGQPQDGRVDIHVLPAGQLGVKAHADGNQRRDLAAYAARGPRWVRSPRRASAAASTCRSRCGR